MTKPTAGVLRLPWQKVRPSLSLLLEERLREYGSPRESSESVALSRLLSGFEEYPFTIQRICEILMVPGACYNKLDRLAWGWARVHLPSKRDLKKDRPLRLLTQEGDPPPERGSWSEM